MIYRSSDAALLRGLNTTRGYRNLPEAIALSVSEMYYYTSTKLGILCMDVGVYKIDEVTNDFIIDKIKLHESFILECQDFDRYSNTLTWLEKSIENEGMSVRIYMRARRLSIGSFAGFAGASVVGAPVALGALAVGVVAGVSIAAHNLATLNPDYEIGKHPIGSTLYVDYKK